MRRGFLVLTPPAVTAQDTPKIESFGGYSFFNAGAQPRTQLQSTNLNGCDFLAKINVTPRLGWIADFGNESQGLN
jgi:hypothetical protein